MESFVLVVHGGAGIITKETLTPEMEVKYHEGIKAALNMGYEVLSKGGSALDATECAVRVLEDCPLFNAGKGAIFNDEGKIELEASIMDGSTLRAGSVTGITTTKNPISAARAVMEKTKYVMITGKGAGEFAKIQGLEQVDPSYFFTEQRYKSYLKAKSEKEEKAKIDSGMGTVGAVSRDKYGKIAAATSTGGRTFKMAGRVGDTPIIGHGNYANEFCGISCSGWGEYFMRSIAAYDVAARMEYKGLSLVDATKEVVFQKLASLGGNGGIIGVDKDCNIALTVSSEGMYRGYVRSDGKIYTAIYKDE